MSLIPCTQVATLEDTDKEDPDNTGGSSQRPQAQQPAPNGEESTGHPTPTTPATTGPNIPEEETKEVLAAQILSLLEVKLSQNGKCCVVLCCVWCVVLLWGRGKGES